MAKNLLQKMNDNYNEDNIKDWNEHINKPQEESKPVYIMVQKHTGPTKIKTSKKGMEKLAKTILDL